MTATNMVHSSRFREYDPTRKEGVPPRLRAPRRPLRTGEVTARDVKQWASEREDVSAYLSRFTEARMIISSLEVFPTLQAGRAIRAD